jgi:tRNA1(Val) A37 N6-methylase TrmN6
MSDKSPMRSPKTDQCREVDFASFQREWVFGFDSAVLAHWKPAARMALQVFDVGSGAGGRFFPIS